MKSLLYCFLIVFSLSAKSQIVSNSKISNLRIGNKSLSHSDTLIVDVKEAYKLHLGRNNTFQTGDLLFRDSNENTQLQSKLPSSVQNLTLSKSKMLVDQKIIKRDLLFRDTDVKAKLIFP
ncbi:hypothetical protein ASG14_09130 [Pedobacter sp. Leaf194]|nr:hypothetical protein ASG14_09130 [Pedobacter sp. Leaf194]